MQLVFQDPHASLNPRMTIEDAVAFSLTVQRIPASVPSRTEVSPATITSGEKTSKPGARRAAARA